MPPETWVRVSSRGRYHRVALQNDAGNYETVCGRILRPSGVSTVASGERPGKVCDRCDSPRPKRGAQP